MLLFHLHLFANQKNLSSNCLRKTSVFFFCFVFFLFCFFVAEKNLVPSVKNLNVRYKLLFFICCFPFISDKSKKNFREISVVNCCFFFFHILEKENRKTLRKTFLERERNETKIKEQVNFGFSWFCFAGSWLFSLFKRRKWELKSTIIFHHENTGSNATSKFENRNNLSLFCDV